MLFDKVVIAVISNPNKRSTFSLDTRIRQIREATSHVGGVEITNFDGLTVDFARQTNSDLILRGLRALSDFEYEFRMALMNRKLNDSINTIFMMPNEKYTHIGSSLIKEVYMLKGKIDDYIPEQILVEVKNKINDKRKL